MSDCNRPRGIERLYCKNPKVCPSGHPLKEVPLSIRAEEQHSGYGRWSCSGCKNDTLGLQGTRFRCDHHKVGTRDTPSAVGLGGGWRGGVDCHFDLCGECFYSKQIQIDDTEVDVEYRNHVIDNIKELLLKHPNGIFEPNFIVIYRDAFGENIDFQKLGYPAGSHNSNRTKFLQSLSRDVLEMTYLNNQGSVGLYVKPSKSLLQQLHQSSMELLSLQDAIELTDDHLPNQFVPKIVGGVRKQVQYPPGLKEGDNLTIIVTEVVSPANFWFQLLGEETSEALESLMADMESFYRKHEKDYRMDSGSSRDECKPGVIMAAPYMDNDSYDFHRVHVNKICKNNVNKVEVFYLDYGTKVKIPISSLRILDEKFSRLPAQALEGKLWGLAAPGGKKTWPKESARRFIELVRPVNDAGFGCYSILKRIQTDASNRVLHLQLIDGVTNKSPQGLCINQQLVREGLARSVEEGESSSLPIGVDASADLGPIVPDCKNPIKEEEDSSKLDVNNNLFKDTENVVETAATNDSRVGDSQTKLSINRVNVSENLSVNLIVDEGETWLSSGDVSSLMPSWRGNDLLAKILQLRHIAIDSLNIVQGSDKFEQIMKLGIKPTEILQKRKIFRLYRVSDVSKLIPLFNKDAQNAKQIIEALEFAAKAKQDSEGEKDIKMKK